MSTGHANRRHETDWPWAGVAGVVAGLLRPATVALLGVLGVSAGPLAFTLQHELPLWWLVHLGYSLAFGMAYSLLLDRSRLRDYVGHPVTGAVTGICYGLALWIGNVVVGWTLVAALILPTATGGTLVGPLLGHLSYGAVLGVVYPLVRRR